MANCYLDNNILVDIEQENVSLSDFLSLQGVKYYFSPSHIEELIEGETINKLSINKRLELIEALTSNNYILPGFPNPELNTRSPYQAYQDAKSPFNTMIRNLTNGAVSNFFFDRDEFLSIVKLKKVEINNIPSQEIVKGLDDILSKYMNTNIDEILMRTQAVGRAAFGTLFNLLDLACYYKDKQTEHSDIARLQDASHAYYAQTCDCFVSQDKRMRYKSKAVYAYWGIKTQVLSLSEFKNITT